MSRTARILLATILVLGAVVGGGYLWLTRSTPVSREQAVEGFREQTRATPAPTATVTVTPSPTLRAAAASTPEANPSPAPRTGETPEPVLTPSPTPQDRGFPQPEAGVYSWSTEGHEEAAGVRRSFPPESQRIVTREAPGRYVLHHVYSEEHEQWFTVEVTEGGVIVHRIRVEVTFGPADEEVEVIFDPPMDFVLLPFRTGKAWEGSWSGDTWGTYTARVFERSTVTVDGEPVEAWGVKYEIEMHGEIEGEETLWAWWSEEHGMTVRERYEMTAQLQGKPGTYHGEWRNDLLTLDPQQ